MAQLSFTHVIGFANTYFTLWAKDVYETAVVLNGKILGYNETIRYTYIQNLSLNEADAVAKVKSLGYDFYIDEDLRGKSRSFELDGGYRQETNNALDWDNFTNDYNQNVSINIVATDIISSNDIHRVNLEDLENPRSVRDGKAVIMDVVRPLDSKFYKRAKRDFFEVLSLKTLVKKFMDIHQDSNVFNFEGSYLYYKQNTKDKPSDQAKMYAKMNNARHAVNARKRLVEIGEMVKFEGSYLFTDEYIKLLESRQFKNEYHFNEGDKVEIEVEMTNQISYDTMYGTTFVQTFTNDEDQKFIYKGTSPKHFKTGVKVKIKATIKHAEYKGTKQTLLQRIKVVA